MNNLRALWVNNISVHSRLDCKTFGIFVKLFRDDAIHVCEIIKMIEKCIKVNISAKTENPNKETSG